MLRLPALLIAACLFLAGCATPQEPDDDGRGSGASFGIGGRTLELPSARQRLLYVARQEWSLWGRGRWDLASDTFEWPNAAPPQEHEPGPASRVLLYWQMFQAGQGFEAGEAQHGDGSLVAWSAVFISFLMKSAGIGEGVFPASALHWDYIRYALDAPNPRGFEALDAAVAPPLAGDLICAPRGETALRVTAFAQLAGADSRGGYHCDLVVEVGAGQLGAIGGNVRNAVTWSRVPLDDNGLLQPTAKRPWIVVLRNHLP
ncbi:DUF2272 domain-containing protein [Azohydromonas aeria]|uniref:DUF2272 domain-containing protein n=1 Tax=Azohydromonas aeria TaxID=2590212 RepID=UPI0012FCF6BA|nr:DUF2272 domain-containing protein [Azohydromonas aeria]